MRSISLLFVVMIFSCNGSGDQKNAIDYFGQKPPVDTAEVFAPGTISTSSFEHSAPSFSPGGKTVFWAIKKMPSYHTAILQMDYENGKWSRPHSPSFCDTTANEVYSSFSPDGKQALF